MAALCLFEVKLRFKATAPSTLRLSQNLSLAERNLFPVEDNNPLNCLSPSLLNIKAPGQERRLLQNQAQSPDTDCDGTSKSKEPLDPRPCAMT